MSAALKLNFRKAMELVNQLNAGISPLMFTIK
jgi:hypothetical protein